MSSIRLVVLLAVISSSAAVAQTTIMCGGGPVTIPAANGTFNFNVVPCGTSWNAVGVAPDAATPAQRSITLNGVMTSSSAAQNTKFLVSFGPIVGSSGFVTLSGMVTTSSSLKVANLTSALLGPNYDFSGAFSWNGTTSVVRIFEFSAPVAGTYEIRLLQTNPGPTNYLDWRLYPPTLGPGWHDRTTHILNGESDSIWKGTTLSPGVHGLAVVHDGVPGLSNTLNYNVEIRLIRGNPSATPTSVSPSPIVACSGLGSVTVTNAAILPGVTTFAINGASAGVTSIGFGSATLQLPQNLITAPGSFTISMNNPAPGGGSTAVNVNVAAAQTAVITGHAPAPILVGSSGGVVSFFGSSFTPTSTITINGVAQSTTYIGSGQLNAFVSTSLRAAQGFRQIVVVDPCFGSSALYQLPIECPTPIVNAANPGVIFERDSDLTMNVSGSGFCPSSMVVWNGTPVSTTYGSQGSLTCTVPAGLLSLAGPATLAVTTPPPGGGMSNLLPRTIRRRYQGHDGDLVLSSGVNGPTTTGPGQSVKTAAPGSLLFLDVSSPMGSCNFAPFVMAVDVFITGAYVDPNPPNVELWIGSPNVVILSPALVPGAGSVLLPGNNGMAFSLPLGFSGVSLFFQAVCLQTSGGMTTVLLSDAHEIRI